MDKQLVLEWIAFAIGTFGTVMWAVDRRWLGLTPGRCWVVSSLMWISFAILKGHYGLAARDVIGASLCVVGMIREWRERVLEKGKEPALVERKEEHSDAMTA